MLRSKRMKRSAAAFMALILFALCFTVLFNSPHFYAVGENEKSQPGESQTEESKSEESQTEESKSEESQSEESKSEESQSEESQTENSQTEDKKTEEPAEEFDIKSKTIGVQRGTTGERKASVYENDGRSDVERYYTQQTLIEELVNDKFACAILDEKNAQYFESKYDTLKVYPKEQSKDDLAFAVRKGNEELLEKVNGAIKKLRDNGTIDSIVNNYICLDSERGRSPYKKKDIKEREGTIILGVIPSYVPYEYYDNDKLTGIDIDVMQAVCDLLKMELEIVVLPGDSLDSLIYTVGSGSVNMTAVASGGFHSVNHFLNVVDLTDVYTTSKQVYLLHEKGQEEEVIDEHDEEENMKDYDFAHKTIGVQLGTTGDILAGDYADNDKKVERYDKGAAAVQSLIQKKIDCVIIDEQPAISFAKKNKNIAIYPKTLSVEEYAFCVSKSNGELLNKINKALKKLKDDGTLKDIIQNYIGTDDQIGSTPYQKKNVERSGTLIVATNAEFPPYEYRGANNSIVGIDMDIMQAVCDEIGMDLQVEDMKFEGILAAVQNGKADVGAAGITVTEDRKTSVDFSNPYTTSKQVIMVYRDNVVESIEKLDGKTIGVIAGSAGSLAADEKLNESGNTEKIEFYTFDKALKYLTQYKIDAVVADEVFIKEALERTTSLVAFDDAVSEASYSFSVKKGNKDILSKVNGALDKLKENGTLEKILGNYFGKVDQRGNYSYTSKDMKRSGTLTVTVGAELTPYIYTDKNGEPAGMDADILRAVCDELGMELKIEMSEDALSDLSDGKADIGILHTGLTDEDKAQLEQTNIFHSSKQLALAREVVNKSFLDKLYDNFIVDNRWRMITDGLLVTLRITGFAMLFGLLLGALIAIVRTVHDQNGKLFILNFICKIYLAIIRGTPVMLQLMIIYFGIFSTTNVSKELVAVIAFGLNSAAYVAEVIRSGINAVDKGQSEAGRCLGLSYGRTMKGIIMPQAFKNILPALLNEVIALLKETAICGTIGLMDLTKGGESIMSLTFDVFIPLIAVAIVYLVIVLILTRIVTILERRLKKNEKQ